MSFVLTEMCLTVFSCHRRGPNPDEYDDGYEAVGAASAARLLQACGPATDVTYAQPDMSQTDSWRQVTIAYPKIDESKEAKKKPKRVYHFPQRHLFVRSAS